MSCPVSFSRAGRGSSVSVSDGGQVFPGYGDQRCVCARPAALLCVCAGPAYSAWAAENTDAAEQELMPESPVSCYHTGFKDMPIGSRPIRCVL